MMITIFKRRVIGGNNHNVIKKKGRVCVLFVLVDKSKFE